MRKATESAIDAALSAAASDWEGTTTAGDGTPMRMFSPMDGSPRKMLLPMIGAGSEEVVLRRGMSPHLTGSQMSWEDVQGFRRATSTGSQDAAAGHLDLDN